jgi:hypothetical protein
VTAAAPNFVLPGTWSRVDLTSDASTRTAIRKLVESRVGKADDRASLRAEMRAELQKGADLARSASAIEYHIADSIAPGVPLAATLSVHLPSFDERELDMLGLAELGELLLGAETTSLTDDSLDANSVPFSVEGIRVVRRISRLAGEPVGDLPGRVLVQFSYWMAAANPARFALLAFATPFVEFEPQLTELFDAVVLTTRWPAGDE